MFTDFVLVNKAEQNTASLNIYDTDKIGTQDRKICATTTRNWDSQARHEIVRMGYAEYITQIRIVRTKRASIATYTSFEKSQ